MQFFSQFGPMDLTPAIILKLVLASALGGLVGLERELRGKPAGLRTNMFICAGSALFTILSELMAVQWGGDATRIASQLIPGIGFIGAGSIIRAQGAVRGLTTAATIFVLASVGMAVGSGFYWTAIFAAVTMLLTLSLLGWLERRFQWKTEVRSYELELPDLETLQTRVMPELDRRELRPHNFSCRPRNGGTQVRFDLDTSEREHQELLRAFTAWKFPCQMVQPLGGSFE
ncbi:MAG TPA: MgtC/SapB family protein [Candidatus Xenobia bacterium]|nr:MgtC/SapB family protein [Candidatus Xenobia bacterium]